jgi:hypothetical protein
VGVVINEKDVVGKVSIARGQWPANIAVDMLKKVCGTVRSFV